MGTLFSYCIELKEEEKKEDIIYFDLTKERQQDLYDVNIDFDKASEAWRNNKLNIACCNYVYICPFIKNNKKCGRRPFNGRQYCIVHQKII
jgi:hypothetical protein